MIVTPRIALRLALIVVLTVIVQISFLSSVSLLGSVPDVIPVVVAALGLLGGAILGAVCGFLTGFLLDSLLLQTLGVSSLALLLVGYLAGRFREGFEISSSLIPPLVIGSLTLLGATAFGVIQLMLGVETPVSLLVLREVLVKALLALILALPVYPLVRRALRPALIDDAPRRRVLAAGARRAGRRAPRSRLRGMSPAGTAPHLPLGPGGSLSRRGAR